MTFFLSLLQKDTVKRFDNTTVFKNNRYELSFPSKMKQMSILAIIIAYEKPAKNFIE